MSWNEDSKEARDMLDILDGNVDVLMAHKEQVHRANVLLSNVLDKMLDEQKSGVDGDNSSLSALAYVIGVVYEMENKRTKGGEVNNVKTLKAVSLLLNDAFNDNKIKETAEIIKNGTKK